MDNELRERILRTLRWMIGDAVYRFNDCKQNLQPGSEGGYSDELKEAIALKRDLEQSDMLLSGEPDHSNFTEQQCIDTGICLGMAKDESIKFYDRYNRQGWVFDTGKPVCDLRSAMRWWKLHNQNEQPEPLRNKEGKTPRQLDIERRGG